MMNVAHHSNPPPFLAVSLNFFHNIRRLVLFKKKKIFFPDIDPLHVSRNDEDNDAVIGDDNDGYEGEDDEVEALEPNHYTQSK